MQRPAAGPQRGNVALDVDAPPPRTAAKPQLSAGNVPPGAPLPAEQQPGNAASEPPRGAGAASTSAPSRNAGNVPPGPPLDAPPARTVAGAGAGARFPGNVDPSKHLAAPEFDQVMAEFKARPAAGPPPPGASQPKVISLLNARGLVPGNMPPEMGDIVKAIEAANSQQIRALKVQLIPGNIPPDAPLAARPLGVEFSPAGGADKKAVAALTMQLTPGNVPPEIDNVLAFLSSAKAQQVSATPAQRAGPSGGVADAS